jgi:hypothetical protein
MYKYDFIKKVQTNIGELDFSSALYFPDEQTFLDLSEDELETLKQERANIYINSINNPPEEVPLEDIEV